MKFRFEKTLDKEEVIVYASRKNDLVKLIENLCYQDEHPLIGYQDGSIKELNPLDVECFFTSSDKVFALIEKVNEPMLTIEMPPCSEGITIYDDVIYVVFESAGEKYLDGTDGGGNSLSPLDKILMIPLENAGD